MLGRSSVPRASEFQHIHYNLELTFDFNEDNRLTGLSELQVLIIIQLTLTMSKKTIFFLTRSGTHPFGALEKSVDYYQGKAILLYETQFIPVDLFKFVLIRDIR